MKQPLRHRLSCEKSDVKVRLVQLHLGARNGQRIYSYKRLLEGVNQRVEING